MDVENHEDIDPSMYVENPMRVETMPVAEVVGIEVISEILIEPKRNSDNETSNTITLTFYQKLRFWFEVGFMILICLAFLTGFILLLVWLNDTELFGPVNY